MGFVGSFWSAAFSGQTTSNLPYETTLALIGLALLLMIPVYRRVLPQLFSPWSGHGLPRKPSYHSTLPTTASVPTQPFNISGSLTAALLPKQASLGSDGASVHSEASRHGIGMRPLQSMPTLPAMALKPSSYDDLD